MLRICLLLSSAFLVGCPVDPVPNDPNASVPFESAPVWKNWTQDVLHSPSTDGTKYYFSPTTLDQLREVVKRARAAGVELRVSGQRHSQPPLVIDDNRLAPPVTARTWLVDLSCYADLGLEGKDQISLDRENLQVTVNAGVREDYLDAFLTKNDLMLQTVTAGGFFSLGGMTAVDVNGATVRAPIFAETVSAFTMMGPDGEVTTIDADDAGGDGWKALQFARVSLGALGVVTSVTIDVERRKHATTLRAGRERHSPQDKAAFIETFKKVLEHHRIETFFNPYANEFLVLWWDIDPAPKDPKPNLDVSVASSCTFAEKDKFGSPYENELEEVLAEGAAGWVQLNGTEGEAKAMISLAFFEVETQFDRALPTYSDLWLNEAARVAFMSYFLELPQLDDAGLGRVWDILQVVHDRVVNDPSYRQAGPLEFRFIKGGDSALAGTYSTNPDSTFLNMDLLAFVTKDMPSDYPRQMLEYYADIEREWYGTFGGLPHNGKMYGFHDPGAGPESGGMAPFAPEFMKDLARRRGEGLVAFEAYRKKRDPSGLFCNDFLRLASLCVGTGSGQ
jgi:FAD/FMN-containing dehydrogenase